MYVQIAYDFLPNLKLLDNDDQSVVSSYILRNLKSVVK
jgi:hypothetical protein